MQGSAGAAWPCARVQLGDEPVELTVDSELDRAVASEPRLLCATPTRAARAQAPLHAVQVGRDVGVDDVLLIDVDGGRAELLRVNIPQQRLVARARVTFHEMHGFAQPALTRAIEQLTQGRDEPLPADASEPAVIDPPPTTAPALPIAASTLPQGQVGAPTAALAPPRVRRARRRARAPGPAPRPEPSEAAHPSAPSRTPATSAPPVARPLRRAGLGLIGPAVALFALGVTTEWRSQHLEDDALSLAYPTQVPVQGSEREAMLAALDDVQRDYERARKLRWLGSGAVPSARWLRASWLHRAASCLGGATRWGPRGSDWSVRGPTRSQCEIAASSASKMVRVVASAEARRVARCCSRPQRRSSRSRSHSD